jgi:hypothetical protein
VYVYDPAACFRLRMPCRISPLLQGPSVAGESALGAAPPYITRPTDGARKYKVSILNTLPIWKGQTEDVYPKLMFDSYLSYIPALPL